MDTGNSSADGSENFVRDCVCPSRHLVGGDGFIFLGAEENNLISLVYFSYIGNIQYSQIHAHASGHRRALAADHNLVPVTHTFIEDCETPVSAFLKLRGAGPAFLLESAEQGQRMGRYSFIGLPANTLLRESGVRN